jgi:CMP-N-acetylneuraminic acid synthetase
VIATPELIALVPMRHRSVRVPGKNYRPLAGRPLFAYVLEALETCPEIDAIVVDTDSPEVRSGVSRLFPRVEVVDRLPELAGDEVPMNRVIAHDVALRPARTYLQTHSTNPLLTAQTISKAVAEFRHTLDVHDALFSVTRWHKRLWDAQGRPLNHDPAELRPTQDLPPVFEENSCLYLFERDAFLATGNRLCRSPRWFEIPPEEALDIDTEAEFAMAEAMLLRRTAGG